MPAGQTHEEKCAAKPIHLQHAANMDPKSVHTKETTLKYKEGKVFSTPLPRVIG